ncbi:globin [Reichenbachiella carrageenanivorans]|uniref:Globin n=1 Tax=Reichenbachiella carrageenanivorans TaxID=2979869 RepID=A0ABY6D3R3_9BACT|nr:globin [Reichenbachiella carrageenanivorans]UXX80544.1 globin [Reichenbachiella carrageenanivorans]
MLTEEQLNQLKLSYGRCTVSPKFFDDFYQIFFASSPAIQERFKNTDMEAQKALLRHGLSHLIKFAVGSHAAELKVNRLAESHDRTHMDIPAWMYEKWIESLIKAISIHDKKINDRLIDQWNQTMQVGINYMIAKY